MDYKTFVKESFLKHKNSGLSAPQIMKQAGAKWSEYKNGHAGKTPKAPKAKAVKKVKAGSMSGGAMASSVPLSSMRSVHHENHHSL